MCKTKDGKIKVSVAESITTGALNKTSATGLAGMALLGMSLISFLALIIFYFFNVGEATNILAFADKVVALISISAAILGVRKISGVIANNKYAKEVEAVVDAIADAGKCNGKDNTIQLND